MPVKLIVELLFLLSRVVEGKTVELFVGLTGGKRVIIILKGWNYPAVKRAILIRDICHDGLSVLIGYHSNPRGRD